MKPRTVMSGERRPHVVLVAYYFPPLGGSGVQRVAKWVKYLPEFGWDVTVLTVEPGAYFAFDETLFDEVREAGARIIRTRTLDPTRAGRKHRAVGALSETKRRLLTYVTGLFFLPDNKRSWFRSAQAAFDEVSKSGPVDVVLSSAPPYTALMVGDALATQLEVPHVLDYRDDWIDNPRHFYPTQLHKRWHINKERAILERSALVLTINESIAHLIRQRRPQADVRVVSQGFDPADFEHNRITKKEGEKIRLVYAGMFYGAQQPDTLLRAVSVLAGEDKVLAERLEIRFVGLFPEEKVPLIKELNLESSVVRTGYKNHRDTADELVQADILWMTVGSQPGGHMISTGKLFDYMGSRKPILALVPEGEVRKALEGYGPAYITDPEDIDAVISILTLLLNEARNGGLSRGSEAWIQQYDRREGARRLASMLTAVMSG